MTPLLRSLYGRLTIAYLGLLLVFCAASIYVTIQTAGRFLEESAQELNRPLAQSLAAVIEPFLNGEPDLEEVEHSMGNLMGFNPWVEIYLLDHAGSIVTYKADPGAIVRRTVPLEPVQAFLDQTRDLPIRGADPKSATNSKIFSAALVRMDSADGYLYVVLHGKEYDTAAAMVLDHYVLRGATANVLLLFLFAGLAGVVLFAVLTRRFRSITRSVEEIARGNLGARIEVESDDEVGSLARSINKMADELQSNLEALQRRDDLRREFIANITHDLKSPLTSIQGYVETSILKNGSLSDDERLDYLTVIHEETVGLNGLVNQLLELARLDAAEVRPVREPFVASELVQDVMVKFEPIARNLGIKLETSLDHDAPMARGDLRMIERVLTNLIDNALRYTPEGGTVTVDTALQHGAIRLAVADTGPGIPRDEIGRVTERFYKGRNGPGRTSGGTGLGLSIVARILEIHDSELSVESEPGEGTRMSFHLEASTPRAAGPVRLLDFQ